jgi:DNA-binding response OmpR family regulator
MTRILIIEDEPDMRLGLEKNLTYEGYEVESVADGESGLERLKTEFFNLILLDVMLPGIDGFELCKQLRDEEINTPIIYLTARGQEMDKVIGLELGAEDYITKPFSLRELSARIKVILRRQKKDNDDRKSIIHMGKIEADLNNYTAQSDGQAVNMTHREFEILKYLFHKKNEVVSRDELLEEIWGKDEFVTRRTVDNFIYKLRKKIELKPDNPEHIITVHKVGYKLIG